jgi:hypothetical protein
MIADQPIMDTGQPTRRSLLLVAGLTPLIPAAALANEGFAATYRVALGGFRLGEASIDVRRMGSRYEAAARLRLAGLASWLFDADATASASGDLVGPDPRPSQFDSTARFDDDLYRISMRYAPLPEVEADPPLRPRPYDAPPETTAGALDPLCAAVALCLPMPEDLISDRVVKLYDGRRRVDIAIGALRPAGEELSASGEIRRVAGFKARHLAEPPIPIRFTWRRGPSGAVLRRAVARTPLGAAVVSRRG